MQSQFRVPSLTVVVGSVPVKVTKESTRSRQAIEWYYSTVEVQTAEMEELNQEQREIWNNISTFWDEQMAEGNIFQRMLVGPSTERLLDLKPGERVLEIGCGNGVMARRLAGLHNHSIDILATDFSESFIELAKARTPTDVFSSIRYQVVDATDENALMNLKRTDKQPFDAVLCNMAMMDMATIDPLLRAVPKLLQGSANSRFVFAIMHPCFNGADSQMNAHLEVEGCNLKTVYSVKVSKYLHVSPELGLGMPGQPQLHYYFHRPLNVLFSSCFRAGLVMDGIEEPTFEPGFSATQCKSDRLGWINLTEIPPVLAVRMRPASLVVP